ncbi:hypothetical protein TREMEDRAFT_64882 [Tremella mesenterica DSM 1558]|uniref:uncharacterized protein n=1 Tax=Tremella mesenterica (strain ATCC 24925 / CBS 8224 / DSM 1558 / NBRC 9311 / NRRL Y-6157 / RJB 2259-6 / UBC 559-6) TaxID=578456 RepID=UPI0003F49F2D|nr:uncharacterized protein TREMEDRAFT_64882 [Tremella mesenterica DSM 1558]EIW67015.1 hypothetical protein TREMEDRAFT_64882 [Tremella mesenterica DSM 1558]
MAQEDASLRSLVGKAYVRGVSPAKLVKLLPQWLKKHNQNPSDSSSLIAHTLLQRLTGDNPPSLIFSYLTFSLQSGLVTARNIIFELLFILNSEGPLSIYILTSISSLVLANPTGLGPSEPLPSHLTHPPAPTPEIGTSASASSPPPTSSTTLGLLLSLIRLCADPSAPPPAPLIGLVSHLLSLLHPYPVPPLDVGLAAGQLMATAPDVIAIPLKNCLAGLMAEMTFAQDMGPLLPHVSGFERVPSGMDGTEEQMAMDPKSTSVKDSSVNIPLMEIIRYLLAYVEYSDRFSENHSYLESTAKPSPNFIHTIHVARHFLPDPRLFVVHLLQCAIRSMAVEASPLSKNTAFAALVERSVGSEMELSGESDYDQNDLPTILDETFNSDASSLQDLNSWIQVTYQELLANAAAEDEGGGFIQPAGWSLATIQDVVTRRLIDLGLLDEGQAPSRPPESDPSSCESLSIRYSTCPTSHLPVLCHLICFGKGTSRSFASELVNCIQTCPGAPPPDNLFSRLSEDSTVLATLTAYIQPPDLLLLLDQHLLNAPDDPAARAEDPQGCLAKFGEGFSLTENVVALFDVNNILSASLPHPALLQDARTALDWADLSSEERGLVSGWVKALFGSEGIDDQVLVATSPVNFCRLACCLIQQAIRAVILGQIELETLHNGLSYFSQNLLSWCLGGIVAWLCEEIARQGKLSAIHFVVLGSLVLSDSFPESLLRANAPAILAIIEGNSYLVEVIQSSGFDASAVRDKVIKSLLPGTPMMSSRAEPRLQDDLQIIRHLELADSTWPLRVLSSMNQTITSEGPDVTAKMIMNEVLFPPPSISQSSDPLITFSTLLLTLPLSQDDDRPLIASITGDLLPQILSTPLSETQVEVFTKVLKRCLVVVFDIDDRTGRWTEELVNELMERRSKEMARVKLEKLKMKKGWKRPKWQTMRTDVEMVCRQLADEEVVGVLPILRKLS